MQDELIRFVDVTLTLSEHHQILNNINFHISRNEVVSIVGRSGSGKTSILRLMSDILPPTKGEIIKRTESGLNIGFMQQSPDLIPWKTVAGNIDFASEITSSRRYSLEKLLKLVKLQHVKGSFPDEISGGMKQRVALARTLSSDPNLLLLDEPLSSLDDFTKEELLESLKLVFDEASCSVVYVTHSISEALFLSDRIIVLSNSKPTTVSSIHKGARKLVKNYEEITTETITPLKAVLRNAIFNQID